MSPHRRLGLAFVLTGRRPINYPFDTAFSAAPRPTLCNRESIFLSAISPIAWFAGSVSHRNDRNCLTHRAIDDLIRKPTHQYISMAVITNRKPIRRFGNSRKRLVEFSIEFQSSIRAAFGVPTQRISELGFRSGTDSESSHSESPALRRARARTLAQLSVSISPASIESLRRFDSAIHADDGPIQSSGATWSQRSGIRRARSSDGKRTSSRENVINRSHSGILSEIAEISRSTHPLGKPDNCCLCRTIPNNICMLSRTEIVEIRPDWDAATDFVRHVIIYYRRPNGFVAQRFLPDAYVVTRFD